MERRVILAKRPDLAMKLEKYGLLPHYDRQSPYKGCAKRWAKDKIPPYDQPEYQAMAERLPVGWEELEQEEFEDLLIKLRSKIDEKKEKGAEVPNKGSEKILKDLVRAAFLVISSASFLLKEKGIEPLSAETQKEVEASLEFSFELSLRLLDQAGILDRIFKFIGSAANLSGEDHFLFTQLLKTTALFLAILSASDGKKEKIKFYFSNIHALIYNGIVGVERAVSERLNEGKIRGELAERSALFLQSTKYALEKSDFEGFYEAFGVLLKQIGVDRDRFFAEAKEIQRFAENVYNTINGSLEEQSMQKTVISQAM